MTMYRVSCAVDGEDRRRVITTPHQPAAEATRDYWKTRPWANDVQLSPSDQDNSPR